jgi:hypothetical protein
LYSSLQDIVRTGKRYPNHYTYRVEETPPEANTSGEANVSQTTTLPELKAPLEANMSLKEISANMNPPTFLVSHLFRMRI